MEIVLRPLHEVTVLNTRLWLNCFDAMDDSMARRRIDDCTNSAAFIGAHLVDSRFFFAKQLGSGLESPFAAQLGTARGIDDVSELPALSEIRAEWERSASVLAERLDSLSANDLIEPAKVRFPIGDATVLGQIAFMVQHESYHIGQLALLRKHYGLPALRYS
jgi:hypothetical protein